MSAVPSEDGETVAVALRDFLARHRIDRGGYVAPRFRVGLGPLTLAFPNPGWLPFHDLHHVALAIPPTFWGEVEISAFELKTGCPNFLVWFLCVGALGFGLLVGPLRVVRAWRRFSHAQRNLYDRDHIYTELLALPLTELRSRMKVAL
jgi:hypothetical protein